MNKQELNKEEYVDYFLNSLISEQEPLEEDFKAVLIENLWDLYQ